MSNPKHIYELVDVSDSATWFDPETLGVFLSKRKAVSFIESMKKEMDDAPCRGFQKFELRERAVGEVGYSNIGKVIARAKIVWFIDGTQEMEWEEVAQDV